MRTGPQLSGVAAAGPDRSRNATRDRSRLKQVRRRLSAPFPLHARPEGPRRNGRIAPYSCLSRLDAGLGARLTRLGGKSFRPTTSFSSTAGFIVDQGTPPARLEHPLAQRTMAFDREGFPTAFTGCPFGGEHPHAGRREAGRAIILNRVHRRDRNTPGRRKQTTCRQKDARLTEACAKAPAASVSGRLGTTLLAEAGVGDGAHRGGNAPSTTTTRYPSGSAKVTP